MFKRPLQIGLYLIKPRQLALATVIFLASALVAGNLSASTKRVVRAKPVTQEIPTNQKTVPPVRATPPAVEPSQLQVDPLESPYPVPWNWVMSTHEQVSSTKGSGVRFYRTPSVISPDGKYAAYSRVQLQVKPELYKSHVSSVMFVENLQTKQLRVVTASSPLANNPNKAKEAGDMPGIVTILIPVSWSASGDRLLARQFEGSLSASDASDYAVVWDRNSGRSKTISPSNAGEFGQAILLGWSKVNPQDVIFQAGELGDENRQLWAVNIQGKTIAAKQEDQPIVFGQTVKQAWAGPQVSW
ncbi:hypothetical protein [[Phormidium] sp. LEGE 05292]|uniref:hypothetical protein n=1 Tax=[Phormidium] sp. LEGE 05292 TaxID=767427 RepID=UPI001D138181|nr:hypothetical protein [Phormidium sp. LEGE 05292]